MPVLDGCVSYVAAAGVLAIAWVVASLIGVVCGGVMVWKAVEVHGLVKRRED